MSNLKSTLGRTGDIISCNSSFEQGHHRFTTALFKLLSEQRRQKSPKCSCFTILKFCDCYKLWTIDLRIYAEVAKEKNVRIYHFFRENIFLNVSQTEGLNVNRADNSLNGGGRGDNYIPFLESKNSIKTKSLPFPLNMKLLFFTFLCKKETNSGIQIFLTF